jgi:hypothetical protein
MEKIKLGKEAVTFFEENGYLGPVKLVDPEQMQNIVSQVVKKIETLSGAWVMLGEIGTLICGAGAFNASKLWILSDILGPQLFFGEPNI